MSKFEGLNKQDIAIIGEWFESPSYQVYKKITQLRRDAIASQLLTTYNEKQVPNLQGQAEGVKNLHEYFKSVNKEYRKSDESK